MGLFKRILGGADRSPPTSPSGGRRFRGDESEGKLATAFDIEKGPFPKQMRLRAAYSDYALYGRWVVVTLKTPADWEAVRQEVFQAYYKQYGLYKLPDGSETIRWNEMTWRAVRDELQILFDPQHQRGQAPSPG